MLLRLSGYFPSIGMKMSSEKELKVLGVEPGRYIAMALSLSLLAGIASLMVSVSLGLPLSTGLLGFALAFSFLLVFPKMELKKRADEIGSAMPFFLRAVGMLLEMGLPFRKALEAASYREGALQNEMAIVLKQMDEGFPFQKALSGFALAFGSLSMKRAVAQMMSAYETGGSGKQMKRIGDELLSLESHRLKEHASKSALFGLMFVISSAILPTFFMVYTIAGGDPVEKTDMALAMLVVFPSVGVLLLLLSKSMMPRSAFPSNGPGREMLLLAAAFVAGFVLFPGLQMVMLVLGGAGGLAMAWKGYSTEKRLEEIESGLPDALFCAAGMPSSARPERVLRLMEEGGFGALSEEAAKSRRQMEMNVDPGAVLEDMAARNRSPMLDRACRMLFRMVETSSLDKLNSLAEDMINAFQERRERSQLLSMQKYTLILGALLMPLIMKMALDLLGQMGSLLGEHALKTAAICASLVPPYIVIYGVVSAMAISDAEGKGSSLAIYSVGLSVVGLLAFHFISF